MNFVLVEPPQAYQARLALPKAPIKEITPRPPSFYGEDYWTGLVFTTIRENGPEAMRFTSVVNATVENWHFLACADRDKKKIELFKLIGKLIRTGYLERVGRKYVNIPASDEKRQAYIAKYSGRTSTCRSMPD
jgi:hypothetical protein